MGRRSLNVAGLDAVDRGIPRRLSAYPGDRFFDQGLVARMQDRVSVLLDGVELAEVKSWDVDAGIIRRPRRNASGVQMRDKAGRFVFEVLKGNVEVRWMKGMGPDSSGGAA